jgi:hypothetical protein
VTGETRDGKDDRDDRDGRDDRDDRDTRDCFDPRTGHVGLAFARTCGLESLRCDWLVQGRWAGPKGAIS